jgi:hypothetical protein
MAKFGMVLIVFGLGSLILKFLGFPLKFEDFMGSSQIWVLIGLSIFGALLFFAGFMTER